MDLHPWNWFAGLSALADQRQTRILFEHLVVAVHAGGTGRHIRIPRFLDSAVAIAAIHPELIHMDRMRKADWLNRFVANTRVLGSEIIPDTSGDPASHQQSADNKIKRQPVCPLREDF